MALSRDKKSQVVEEISQLLANAKMTVISRYQGTGVKQLQQLRREAKANGTTVKVFKNRLVKRAVAENKALATADTSELKSMLLYSFNEQDEVAPAKVVADFAKTNPTLEFVGAISADGRFLSANEVKSLAALPSREQLIAEVLATLQSPVNDITSGLAGNLHGLLDAVAVKAS